MSTLTSPRNPVKPIRRRESRPVVASLVLTINGTPYDVEPIANAPGGLKSYRLAKVGGDEAVYDVDAFGDRVTCSCPSYLKTHEGTSSLCKHGRALTMVGLVDYPNVAEAPAIVNDIVNMPDEFDEPESLNFRDFRIAPEPLPKPEVISDLPPASVVAPFDAEPYDILNVVSRGDASWINAGPKRGPTPPCWTPRKSSPVPCCDPTEVNPCQGCTTFDGPADLSDEGWDDDHIWTTADVAPDPDDDDEADPEVLQLIEDGAELEAEGEAPLEHADGDVFRAVAEGRAEIMREFGWVPVPYLVTRENAIDLMADSAIADGWAESIDRAHADAMRARAARASEGDDAPIMAREPAPRTLAEQVDDHARELRALGSPLGDLLAERAESLAEQIRFLDATTVGQFRDRLDAMLDCAALEASARR